MIISHKLWMLSTFCLQGIAFLILICPCKTIDLRSVKPKIYSHFISSPIYRYANYPSLLGIELLNEPSAAAVPLDVLVSYYARGYQIVRNYSPTVYVIFCQRIGNADPMELYQANIGVSNTVVDLHYYNLFDPYFDDLNATENIQFIYKSRMPQVQALNSANGPLVFVGMVRNIDLYDYLFRYIFLQHQNFHIRPSKA